MNVIFTSDRLVVRTFTINDASLIFQLNNDPEVIKYTYDPLHNLDEAEKILTQSILPLYALYNHGRWAIHLKHTLEFIGWCGLKYRHERNEVDLGYRFIKKYWGIGYATDAAYACLQYGFRTLKLQNIVGRCAVENIVSAHVLEKCGMNYIGVQEIDGHRMKTFIIHNPFIPE